ncbi:aminotransferase class I/II-fold pyridoxal phosphate-dependent enzyme [Nonomuraea sp. B10E15]|uniref:aminotransferase class I/II-fold pyridoxal phosphate-dependent enzyme n=1 Tax=Nonomuraea sp. B10E15 TaxID=3153560 RepID=UPI00325E77E2
MGHPVDLTGPQATWPSAGLRLWRAATDHVLGLPDAWHPPPPQGDRGLREVLGAILREDPDDVLITSGVRAGASVIAQFGESFSHEQPSFTGTVTVLRACRRDVNLHPWAELLEHRHAGRTGAAGVVWLTDPWRNPDGATLTPDGWRRVEAVARTRQVVVNEVYRWFGKGRSRPARVWMTGSLSKLAGSGAGLGWIRGTGMDDLARRQHARPSLFWQRCWAYFLAHGGLELLIDHTVRPTAEASRAFLDELVRVAGAERCPGAVAGSPFFLLPVPHTTTEDFVGRLAADGVRVGPGDDFLAPSPSVRVCFAGVSGAGARHAARTIGMRLLADAPFRAGSHPAAERTDGGVRH